MFRLSRIVFCIVYILLLIILVSCKKDYYSYFGISKVEITSNLYTEVPHLEVYVFTTTDYSNLSLKKNKLITEVSSYRSDIKLINEKEIPGYLYLFYITFEKKEFILQNLTFLFNNKEIECSIGMYQTLFLEPSTIEIDSSINIYLDTDLKGLFNVHNKLYSEIYLTEQRIVSVCRKQTLEPFVLDKIMINSNSLKSLDIFSVNPKEKYHQIGGIVQTRFKTNLDEQLIYTSYYYNNMYTLNYLSSVGIDVSVLEEVKNS